MKRLGSIIALSAMLVLVSAGNASALELRLVHAVPGAGAAGLGVQGKTVGPVSFGGVTSYARVGGGRATLVLRPAGGGKPIAHAVQSLTGKRVTVVATKVGQRVDLRLLSDGAASARKARLRVVNAGAELGTTALEVDGRPVFASLAPGQASGYRDVEPGTYRLAATRKGGKGGALASKSGVNLAAGTATTAILAGSGGEPTRLVLASDSTVTPKAAPGTGFGGLAGGTPWLAAIAAAVGAGALGGAVYTLTRRHPHGA